MEKVENSYQPQGVLLRSHLFGWVNPLMLLSFCCIAFFIVALLPDIHIFGYVYHSLHHRLATRIFVYLGVIPLFAIITLWNLRRVIVYPDRVETKYIIGLYSGSTIMMDDVDGYCIENYFEEVKSDKVWYKRILLIKGNKLYMYVSNSECSNFSDMEAILTDYFCLEKLNRNIELSVVEQEKLKDGKGIVYNGITNEEAAALRKRRDERLMSASASSGWDNTNIWTFELTGWKNVGLILIIAGILMVGGQLYSAYNESLTDRFEVVDYATTFSDNPYVLADSVDVDWQYSKLYEQRNGTEKYEIISKWAFPIRATKNFWATISVLTDERDHMPDGNQLARILQVFRERHHYKLIKGKSSDIIEKIFFSRVVKSEPTFIQLDYDDEEIKMGRVLYRNAVYHLEINDDGKALSQLKQSFDDGYPRAAITIGEMYMKGKGVEKDIDEAIVWFKKAIDQTEYLQTKADAYNLLSYAYAEKSQWNLAIASCDSAIALRPDDINLYDSKGEHLFMSGDTAQAKSIWEMILEKDPELKYLNRRKSQLK